MKLHNIICSAVAVAVLSSVVGCSTEHEEKEGGHASQAQLMSQATVSKAEAERTALARVPNGTIKEAELEQEKGRLIWSFDVATPDSKDITEVNIDAKSGEVVAIDKESPSEEAKEAAAENANKSPKKEKDDDDKN